MNNYYDSNNCTTGLCTSVYLYTGVNLTEVIVKKWVDEGSVLGADVKFNISKH